ncbi:MAG: hypothetical protein Q8Q09_26430 [Deltaproteobacteria bacterium]|nr:hypothetical protein [Deltaproteobacteria bacterium]
MFVPLWIRALLAADRLAWYAYRAHELLRDELLFAGVSPDKRSAVTQYAYNSQRNYLPGGSIYVNGLFSWEESLLANEHIPQSGRVLLGAAGGGREIQGLAQRGYDVTAFEPNPVLREGATQTATQFAGKAHVFDGRYEDLTEATRGHGPLASLKESPAFDLVILGWGSLTHILEEKTHTQILRDCRALAPKAPLMMSFFIRSESSAISQGKSDRARALIRRTLAPFRSHQEPISQGLGFESSGGFVYAFTETEIHALALKAGYEVALFSTQSFPHAILLPLPIATT